MVKKRYYFIAILVVVAVAYLLFRTSEGPEIKLNSCQNISSPGNYILMNNVSSDHECFVITANDVVFNGNGYKIYSEMDFQAGGISVYNTSNVVVENTVVEGYEIGLFAQGSSNLEFVNNSLAGTLEGVVLDNVTKSTIENNIIEDSSNIGIALDKSQGNVVQNNEINIGLETIYELNSADNKIAYNINNNNINQNYFQFKRNVSETYHSGVPIEFSVVLPDEISQCVTCSYEIKLSPSEDYLSLNREGNTVVGSFTPTRIGIYSVEITVIDQNRNFENAKYSFLINATKEDTVEYYVRGLNPTHGQSHSLGLYHADSGSLLLSAPTDNEIRICSDWVQISPDELPKYQLGEVKEINFTLTYIIYNQTSDKGYVGIERRITEDEKMDQSVEIGKTAGGLITKSFSFQTNWRINSYWRWYWQAIKIFAPGSTPTLFVNPGHPDKASFKYIYSSTPAIRSLNNPNILVLSATMKGEDSSESLIVLEGNGDVDLTIEMPNKNMVYAVSLNSGVCDDEKCSIIKQESGLITLKLKLDSISNLKIFSK